MSHVWTSPDALLTAREPTSVEGLEETLERPAQVATISTRAGAYVCPARVCLMGSC